MKWSDRIQVVTGHTCLHILLHAVMAGALVWGWRHQMLMQVSVMLLSFYTVMSVGMLLTQRLIRLRRVGDFFEEFTTTYYSGAAMLVLYLISRVLHHHLLLACLGIVMLAGPALVSLLVKEPQVRHHRRQRRWF